MLQAVLTSLAAGPVLVDAQGAVQPYTELALLYSVMHGHVAALCLALPGCPQLPAVAPQALTAQQALALAQSIASAATTPAAAAALQQLAASASDAVSTETYLHSQVSCAAWLTRRRVHSCLGATQTLLHSLARLAEWSSVD